jgi:signal transduction histidine kinase
VHANELNIKKVQEIGHIRLKRISAAAVAFMAASLVFCGLLAFFMFTQILAPIRRLSKKTAMTNATGASGNELKDLSCHVNGLMENMDRARSELVQSQEMLMHSEKMALVGKLATEVAHSIRNPMTSINMRLFSLKRNLELTEFQQEDFEVVSEEMRRLDNIVRNFLEFSKPHKLKKQTVHISRVIDMTIDLLCYRLELNSVEIIRKQSANLPPIDADPELLKEVFVNLMVNACEAMENGGEIVISEEEALAENIGRAVLVKFTDNGPGMSEEVRKRVLEPFETTKENGTGLGLFIAVRIIEEHGGTMQLHSKEGHGTTFAITFPASE